MLEFIKKLNCEKYTFNFDENSVNGSILEIKDNFILIKGDETLAIINVNKVESIIPFQDQKQKPASNFKRPRGI